MIILPQNPHKVRFRRDKHTREHRDRVEAEFKRKRGAAAALASSESNRGRQPVSLPTFSIQQEPEE